MTDKLTVLKTISTPTRRFPVGAEITEADLDGPVTLATWRRLGQLAAPPKAAKGAGGSGGIAGTLGGATGASGAGGVAHSADTADT